MALNTLRAAAAIIVCLGHVRGYILVPRAEIRGAFNEGMYALTSLGHGAVMVFFVLSGYFVGGSVIRGRRRGTFRWADYLISRSIRLWVVLIPALLLTLIADRIGIASFLALYGLTQLFAAWKLLGWHAWARGPLLFTQLVQLGLAWGLRGAQEQWLAILMAVSAAIALGCLIAPAVTRALLDDGAV